MGSSDPQEVAQVPRTFAAMTAPPQETGARDPKPVTWLGATVKNLTGEAEKSAAGIGRETGVLFVEVPPASPPAEAGFRRGDVILKANDQAVDSLDDLHRIMTENKGQTIRFTVFNAVERSITMRMPDRTE